MLTGNHAVGGYRMTKFTREHFVRRIREHLADLASARTEEERERILRRVAFATRQADRRPSL